MKVELRIFLFLIKLVTMKVSDVFRYNSFCKSAQKTAAADFYPGVLYQKYSHRKNNPNISFLTFLELL